MPEGEVGMPLPFILGGIAAGLGIKAAMEAKEERERQEYLEQLERERKERIAKIRKIIVITVSALVLAAAVAFFILKRFTII
jgi:hypothetical protein